MARGPAVSLVLCLLFGCARDGGSSPSARRDPPRRWHYEISLDQALSRAEARVCFQGPPPTQLRAGVDHAAPYLEHARWLGPGPGRKLPVRGGMIQLQGLPADGCLHYAVDLERAAGQGVRLAERLGDDLLAAPNLWLWRPQRRDAHCEATLELRLPRGVEASLPWPRRGKHYLLRARDFRYDSYAAFGSLRHHRFSQSDAHFEVSVVGEGLGLGAAELERWLRRTIQAVADVRGRFPVPRAQVLLASIGPHTQAVPYGSVARGGGASVLLLVSSTVEASALLSDWVAPHEFSHLYLPYVEREGAWLSEGLATYYQEVLRVRAGLKSEREAWQTLVDAVREATAMPTGRTLAEESEAMHRTHEYRRVYWAGASFALIADARLRRRSQSAASLDTAIAGAKWWNEPPRTYSAAQVLRALDASTSSHVFTELAAESLPRDFPPIAPVLTKLGVRTSTQGTVELDDEAPWAAVRRAIMQARADR